MKEFITKAKNYISNNESIIIAAFIVLCISCIISFGIGRNAQIDKQELQQSLKQSEELNKLQSQIDDAKNELNSQKSLLEEVNQFKSQKEEKLSELSKLDNDIATKSATSSSLDAEISDKTAELDGLKNLIQKTGEAPKVLGAGDYTVGTDIPAGRYIVTGDSNFVVRSSYGSLKVNTILGGGKYGEESYTCTLEIGDTLELASKDTFTPVK